MNFNYYGRDMGRAVTISHGDNIYRNCQLVTSPQTHQQYLAPSSSYRHRNESRQQYQSSPSPRIINQQLRSFAPFDSVDEVLIRQNGPARRHYSSLPFQQEDDVMVLDMFPTPSSFWPMDEDLTSSMAPKVDVSDETIEANLKIKVYNTSTGSLPSEASNSDEDHDICVVCQDDFESQEKIGALRCGHEYHVHCIKKWLKNKNVCPICKATPVPSSNLS